MPGDKCKECGCSCKGCFAAHEDMHLYVEIENLKQRLMERDTHIATMESNFLNEADKYPNGELGALKEELLTWQDKYSRLYEAHKRIQKVNQSLEDKLLKLVDKTENDKMILTKDVTILSHKLADANYIAEQLQTENEQYRNDVNVAIQFLQCKPENFVSQRLDSLPVEVQAKVSTYLANKRKPAEEKKPAQEVRSIKVPISTFPPTAMVYSIPKSDKEEDSSNAPEKPELDLVSASIIAKVLEERERDRSNMKHCDSCTCSRNLQPTLYLISQSTVSTQTEETEESLLLREKRTLTASGEEVHPVQIFLDGSQKYPGGKEAELSLEEQKQQAKGPRYCSMRVQSGTKNILLDNIVLYTRQTEKKGKTSKEEGKRRPCVDQTEAEAKQQRVTEWIQSIDQKKSSSDSESSSKSKSSRLPPQDV